ncbi:MAG: SBBP repeat-containing protein [Candidatus Cloacimonetes bacterium]|nr:SBBP repeat-containing protein [Candidatus Cloacimonadota bacterium]
MVDTFGKPPPEYFKVNDQPFGGKMKAMKTMLFCFALLCGAAVLGAQAPEWEWAVRAGGGVTEGDISQSIAIDSQGNQYVTGYFQGTASFGSQTLTSSGGYDIFVAKLDSNGNWLWAVKAGGTSSDEGFGIAVDGVGNAYLTGYFRNEATFGSHTLTASGSDDIFAAKLDPNGNWLWAVKADCPDYDDGMSIAVDNLGNAYLTGRFSVTASFGSYSITSSGDNDTYVAKINAEGNWLWAVKAGGTGNDLGSDIAVDNVGNIYVTGSFMGTSSFGTYTLTSYGDRDIYVAKLDNAGNWLWVNKAGGGSYEAGRGIEVDNTSNIYLTGDFRGWSSFGSYNLVSSGYNDIFAAKLDTDGNWLWVVQAGGTREEWGSDIAVDNAGNSYLTGVIWGTVSFGPHTLTASGYYDIFAAKLDPSGNWLWALKAGSEGWDSGQSITMDALGNTLLTGSFQGTATFGSNTLVSSGNYDIFVAKLSPYLFSYFIADHLSGPEPLMVQFTDQSNPGGYPISDWLWSFGDGGSSTEQNPLHTYLTPGVYTVSLTVMDQNYQTSTMVRPDYITVIERVETIDMITAENLGFGIVYLEEQSPWQAVTLANTGNVDLTLGDPTFFQQTTQFEWQWQQRDVILSPGSEATLLVRFVPQAVGPVTDVLHVANNSTNLPVVEVQLSATGEYVPPAIPENVAIAMAGDNAVITWDAVTQNTHSQPITPDGYLVFYNGSSDAENGLYYFLAVTPELTHTHVRVGEFASNMFYRVKAYKYYGRGSFDLAALGLEPGMTEAEVTRRLKLASE